VAQGSAPGQGPWLAVLVALSLLLGLLGGAAGLPTLLVGRLTDLNSLTSTPPPPEAQAQPSLGAVGRGAGSTVFRTGGGGKQPQPTPSTAPAPSRRRPGRRAPSENISKGTTPPGGEGGGTGDGGESASSGGASREISAEYSGVSSEAELEFMLRMYAEGGEAPWGQEEEEEGEGGQKVW
jgi:hypothetical protein